MEGRGWQPTKSPPFLLRGNSYIVKWFCIHDFSWPDDYTKETLIFEKFFPDIATRPQLTERQFPPFSWMACSEPKLVAGQVLKLYVLGRQWNEIQRVENALYIGDFEKDEAALFRLQTVDHFLKLLNES